MKPYGNLTTHLTLENAVENVSCVDVEDKGFSVFLHNVTGRWRIISAEHMRRARSHDIARFKSGLDHAGLNDTPRVITVFLNNTCNLRCTYCRFDALTHHAIEHGEMDVEAVIARILSLAVAGEKVQLHVQGGEPFLQLETIDGLCSALTEANSGAEFSYHVTTNGTIATSRAFELLRKHRIQTTVSLDGLRALHDRFRVFSNGKGSYDRAIHFLSRLREEELPFGIFCVITEPRKMLEIYEYFVEKLGLHSFLLAPLELDGKAGAEEIDTYFKEFTSAQFEILRRNISRYVATGVRISENLTESYLRYKILPGPSAGACSGSPSSACGKRMHSIERNGDLRECQNTRLIQNKGPDYIKNCLMRYGLCKTCEIRAHCSSPVCVSRLDPSFVEEWVQGNSRAVQYIQTACHHLKGREMEMFDLFYKQKDDVLKYFFEK